MFFDPTKPFNDLPKIRVSLSFETPKILKKAIDAHRELAQLKGQGLLIPNQSVLIQTIGLQEAKNSSAIENIVTTNDELYRAFADHGENSSSEAKEVLHYKDALFYGFKAIKEGRLLTTPLFEELVQIITETTRGIRKNSGTKLVNAAGEVIYTPPEGESLIRDKLQDLENFLHTENSYDPLVKLAISHYQFEAIHPFTDGNGRTGRIINILFLIQQKILDIPVLYLSRFITNHKTEYYLGLRSITEKENWENWILFMLTALEETAKWTKEKILAIYNLMENSALHLKKEIPKIYSRDLLEILFQHPYTKIRFLENAKIAHRQTASLYLKELTKIGFLREVKFGRDKYYINDAFLKALTE